MIGLPGTFRLTQSVAGPSALAQVQANQRSFLGQLQSSGSVLTPVSYERLESMDQGHAFFGVLRDVRREAGFSPDRPALWRVDYGKGVSAPQREACSLWAGLEKRGYYPPVFRSLLKSTGEGEGGLLEDPLISFAAVSTLQPSSFRLVPRIAMPSIQQLSEMLDNESWPLYAGPDEVRIHGYRSSAYGAGVHDIRHYVSWKHWSTEDRQDSVRLYRALRGLVNTTLPSLGSLAGRIGARLFYGDGFFHREMTALDEALSGPPGTGNGIFPQMSLINVAANWDGDKNRLYRAVEKAFAGSSRQSEWNRALEFVKDKGVAS